MTSLKEQEQYALDTCRSMRASAEKAHSSRCIEGEVVFWYEYERSLIPGHIRTGLGRAEFRISRCCEYHFDQLFGSEEETPELWDAATETVVGPIHGAV